MNPVQPSPPVDTPPLRKPAQGPAEHHPADAQRRSKPASAPMDYSAEPIPHLRPTSKGYQWVRLDVGWQNKFNPRAIVDLLAAALGVPAADVRIIEMMQRQSFAQVPREHLDSLKNGPMQVGSDAQAVSIAFLPEKQVSAQKFKTHNKSPIPPKHKRM